MASGFAATGISISEKDGLPVLGHDGARLLSADYQFWGKDWNWAGQKTRIKTKGPLHYSTSAHNKKLDFRLRSEIQKVDSNKLVWEYALNAKSQKADVIGGGISFKLNLSDPKNNLGMPALLPQNRGFTWGNKQGKGIEVRFDPPLKSIYFERSKKSRIRAFFYSGEVPQGELRHSMTVTLFGDIEIRQTQSERFGTTESSKWPQDRISWQSFPVDLSFLNAGEKPAGKRGFVKARNEDLVFEDGTRARFWGTNITAATLFKTSKSNVKKQASRLSKLGFNLVRLHHHDSVWVNPNIFGSKDRQDTLRLSKKSLDKLDWWIKCLKEEGIYIWLDLHVQRGLKKGDNIFAFDEIRGKTRDKYRGADLKGYNYVNPSIQSAMQQFNLAYVTHVNPYTKLAYKDEPAIAAMLLTNENDVTTHFGNRLLPDKKVPEHNKIYMREAEKFAKRHGLPVNTTWHSWKHGPSKLFLNDLEHRFNQDMISGLRAAGVKVPIVTTSTWGNNPLSSLPALTTGDMVDVHAYGGTLEVAKNPLKVAGMTSWMAAGQVADMPLSVTEWNVSPFPATDRHASVLLVASKAAHQGWDAMMQYAYSQNSLNKIGKPSNWHAHNDPAMLSVMPAAALLYRRQHVKEATTTYYLATGTSLYNRKISPGSSIAIRTASEKGKLVIAMPQTKSLPWLKPSSPPEGAIIIEDHKQSFIKRGISSVTSDTGELHRDWKKGIYTIDSQRTQAAMGWLGDNPIRLGDSSFDIKTRNASVVVQSLDENPIKRSRGILITLATNSMPDRNKLPFHTEPITGSISVNAEEGLKLYYLDQRGNKESLAVDFRNGEYRLELNKYPFTHWLLLTDDSQIN